MVKYIFFYLGGDDVYRMDDQDVMAMGMNIIFAGYATTPVFIDVLLGLLVNYQDIQESAYHEIQEVIGDRIPTCEDKSKLPFIEGLCHILTLYI